MIVLVSRCNSLLSTLDGRVLGLGALFDMIDREVLKPFANMPGSEKKVLRVEGGLVKTSQTLEYFWGSAGYQD